MTGIALVGGADVSSRLAGCSNAIVTAQTGAEYFVVINDNQWCPAIAVVAGIALVTAGDVVAWFAECYATIVTGDTSLCFNRAVIECAA